MDGFVVVDKPAGITSHDAVAAIRRSLRTKRVGHGGTLDPLATGVLVIAVGKATRLLSYLVLEPKRYAFRMVFGVTTETQDAEGRVVQEKDASVLTQEAVEHVLSAFRGEIQQAPPMYSAVHHEGKRLYEMARRGMEVERQPRTVTIHSLTLDAFEPGPRATADLTCACSSGTYVRTLCHDIGAALGVGAYLASLMRTACGSFDIADAVPLDEITEATPLVPCRDALSHLDALIPAPAGLVSILHGNPVRPSRPPQSKHVCILNERKEMVALAEFRASKLHPLVVLAQE
ncbi:MAG: tRNA pseudouridine synthase B [Fimbriimonadales bacterium]